MPTSTTSSTEDQALPVSSQKPSQTSSPNKKSSLKEKEEKLGLAYVGRLIQDNSLVLQMTAETNQAHREQSLRLREAEVNKTLKELGEGNMPATTPSKENEGMGDILIDSPITHTHNYPAAPAPSLPTSPPPLVGISPAKLPTGLSLPAKVAIGAALLAGAGAGGLGIYNALQPSATNPPPVVTPSMVPTEFDRINWEVDTKGAKKEVSRQRIRIWPDGRPTEKKVNGAWVPDDGN